MGCRTTKIQELLPSDFRLETSPKGGMRSNKRMKKEGKKSSLLSPLAGIDGQWYNGHIYIKQEQLGKIIRGNICRTHDKK